MYSEFELVDVYQIFCHLLGIKPNPNDGVWDRVSGLLRNSAAPSPSPSIAALAALALLVTASTQNL